MRIAIDYDGTLMLHPELYRFLIDAFLDAGAEVGIMTGRSDETKPNDLDRLDDIIGTNNVDKLAFFFDTSLFNDYESTLEQWIHENAICMDRDELVCMFKARMCTYMSIGILFDDAADKVRLYMPEGAKTVVFKSPADWNMVVKKWGNHKMEYEEVDNETIAAKRVNS